MKHLPDGLILLSGGKEIPRNFDVNYVFRQNSNFLYLSGVEEPGCALLLDPRRKRCTLFMPRIDEHHRVWEGHVPSPAEAKKLFGVDKVEYLDVLSKSVKKAGKGYRKIYADSEAAKRLGGGLKKLKNSPAVLADSLEELRAVKTPGELAFLKEANRISGVAHRAVMAETRPGMHEYEVQAIFESVCRKAGLQHLAYPTIAAAGRNGSVLHYRRNDAQLKRGELLLIDAGAEVNGYAADITRTIPIDGRFTRRQRDVYSIVLETQKSCITKACPGINSVDLHIHSMRIIAEGLKSLGILKGSLDGLVESGAVRLFYPHGIGHLLGLDVHDGMGGKRRKLPNPSKIPARFIAKLEPGFVMTVEPGIYFIELLLRSPKLRRRHRGSVDFTRALSFLEIGGIRIEDDVVIRPSGPPRNLTTVPKEIEEVEECRRS